jgi:hypothetical protein
MNDAIVFSELEHEVRSICAGGTSSLAVQSSDSWGAELVAERRERLDRRLVEQGARGRIRDDRTGGTIGAKQRHAAAPSGQAG